jgi:hypothetical protein
MRNILKTVFAFRWIGRSEGEDAILKSRELRVTNALDGPRIGGTARSIASHPHRDETRATVAELETIAAHRRVDGYLHACFDPVLAEEIPPRLLRALQSDQEAYRHHDEKDGPIGTRGMLIIPHKQAIAACFVICAFSAFIGWHVADMVSHGSNGTSPVASGGTTGTEASIVGGLPQSTLPESALQETSPHYPNANGTVEKAGMPTQQTAGTSAELALPDGYGVSPAVSPITGDTTAPITVEN